MNYVRTLKRQHRAKIYIKTKKPRKRKREIFQWRQRISAVENFHRNESQLPRQRRAENKFPLNESMCHIHRGGSPPAIIIFIKSATKLTCYKYK